jgi:cyclopropane fatty-acyl-phospholipid synthase-like methyltransferase
MPSVGVALLLALAVLGAAQAARVPLAATPPDVVDRMLRMAGVGAEDVVYDLGCGDGRIVIAAAQKFGARGVGVDIDPLRVESAQASAKRAGVEHLVTFRVQDALETDVSEATVVTLYLVSALNVKLRPRLMTMLRPGARIVSHNFGMGEWEPNAVDVFMSADGVSRTLYRWNIR